MKVEGGDFLNNNLPLSDFEDSTIIRESYSLLKILLKDYTTGQRTKQHFNIYKY